MNAELEFTFTPDGAVEDVWVLRSSLLPDQRDRVLSKLTSLDYTDKLRVFQSVVSAVGRVG